MTALVLLALLAFLGTQKAPAPFLDSDNTPWAVKLCLDTQPVRYRIDRRMNPFYLRGDFNGDSSPDYAVLIEEISSGKKGIAICLGGATPTLNVLGAGIPIPPYGGKPFDDLGSRLNEWVIIDRGELSPKWDSIYLGRYEDGGGTVSWDGKRFVWDSLD